MVSISKPEAHFFRRHAKHLLVISLLAGLVIGSVLSIADMEGAFLDPQGQLNNALKMECDSGILANRNVPITDDGEYNWMFIKDQVVNITVHLIQTNHTLNLYFQSFATNSVIQDAMLNADTPLATWNLRIQTSGHWRLEMVNGDQVGHQYFVSVFVEAFPIQHPLGLIDCLNPGDLFKNV